MRAGRRKITAASIAALVTALLVVLVVENTNAGPLASQVKPTVRCIEARGATTYSARYKLNGLAESQAFLEKVSISASTNIAKSWFSYEKADSTKGHVDVAYLPANVPQENSLTVVIHARPKSQGAEATIDGLRLVYRVEDRQVRRYDDVLPLHITFTQGTCVPS